MLGALAGALAAVAVLPTIVPLTQRVDAAEDVGRVAQATAAARAVGELFEANHPLRPGIIRTFAVDGVRIVDPAGHLLFEDGTLPLGVTMATMCPPGEAGGRVVTGAAAPAAVGCHDIGSGVVVASVATSGGGMSTLSALVVGLAAMVGISTAFGVLQLLSPLSRLKEGLERVGMGERGVHVATTGLAELDDLVERVNAAARAMEDREDAVMGRIQVVQEIARVVAHEIRNPLQSVELLAGLIAVEDDRAERDALAASIQNEVRVLERVVSRMLRGTDGPALRLTRRRTRMGELVQKVIDFRLPEARHRGIQLTVGPMTERTLDVDRTLLSRAIENLVANALAFAPEGTGRVRVSTDETIEGYDIVVEDNGPGVDDDLGDVIYQAEYTTRPGGTGLGLSLVQGVLASHGGYVEHGRSDLGGARFRLHLPLVAPPTEEASVAHPGR